MVGVIFSTIKLDFFVLVVLYFALFEKPTWINSHSLCHIVISQSTKKFVERRKRKRIVINYSRRTQELELEWPDTLSYKCIWPLSLCYFFHWNFFELKSSVFSILKVLIAFCFSVLIDQREIYLSEQKDWYRSYLKANLIFSNLENVKIFEDFFQNYHSHLLDW